MEDKFIRKIGICEKRHYTYLKRNNPTVINVMRLNGTLEQYLTDIDLDAQEIFEPLTKQY